jgi:hypothetical protein
MIVIFPTDEMPEERYPNPYPLPIPQPYDELLAVTVPFTIAIFPTHEGPP